MSNPIPNDAIVTYVGTWPHTDLVGFNSPDNTLAKVGALLGSKFGLPVKSAQVTQGGILSSALGNGFSVKIDLQVENGFGFGSVDDIIAIVRSAVYSVIGDYPTADSIPFTQVPGQKQQGTGQPAPKPPQDTGCIAGTSNDLSGAFSLSCWWSNMTQKGLASVGFLAIIVVIGVGVALYFGVRPHRGDA